METMKAIICPKYGPADVLQIRQVNKPIHKQNEILIKIFATSVTNSDLFIRSSNIPSKMMVIPFRLMMGLSGPRNPIIGEVFSGRITAVGDEIRRFMPGDKVYGLTGFSLGVYADYKCMKEVDSKQGCLAIMPDNISYEEATSAAYGGLLAVQYMEKRRIDKGNRVLIYGASGTTGTFAVQYAKHLGAIVTAVCGTKNIEFVKSLGADIVIDYTSQNSITQLEEYDFILDAVGKAKTSALKKACVKSLSKSGKYGSIDESPLLLKSDRLNQITEMVEAGIIKPVNDRVYSFEQIIEAHKYVETGHKRGNVAVTVNTDL